MHNTNRPVISTHVLDVTRGEPAAGVPVTLARLQGGKAVAQATRETDADGRIADLLSDGLEAGTYQLVFEVGTYLKKRGGPAPFFSRVTLDLEVSDPNRRYHVPLLVTPFSCASYRGS